MEERLRSEWGTSDLNMAEEIDSGTFQYNKHNESIFDDYRYFPHLKPGNESVVKFDPNKENVINQATLRALIVQLTSPEVIDYNLICDFFLTYRLFSDSHTIMSLLLTRLIWSLQYVNSFKEETEKTGKLVLLRTFVVLRHWVLNYFIDDFKHDYDLCDTFSTVINKITSGPSLIRSNMVFELKIFTDLKTHWLSQFNQCFDANINIQSRQTVYETALPMVSTVVNFNKLTKSTTEASIHTNPSFRRSAMLSLYDNNTHHKCLIIDESISNDENPQLSVNNLLAQHKSSRTSLNDKLRAFHSKANKEEEHEPSGIPNKHVSHKTKYMHFTDSSLALKKTTGSRNSIQKESKDGNITATGFSTNGQVKLPTSKIYQLVPPTPVKKMEYTIKDFGHAAGKRKSTLHIGESMDFDGLGRRVSIRKFVEGWKKSFNSNELRAAMSSEVSEDSALSKIASEEINDRIKNRVDTLSARIIDELEYLIRFSIVDNTGATDNDGINLSEIPMNSSMLHDNERGSESNEDADVSNNQRNSIKLSFTDNISEKSGDLSSIHEHRDDISIQDVSELNIEKIDNIFSQDEIYIPSESARQSLSKSRMNDVHPENDSHSERSFREAISINWNDEGNLDFENSASLALSTDQSQVKETKESTAMIRSETRYFDVSSETPPAAEVEQETNSPANSSISLPSDYSTEVADLGIAMSPQSLKRLTNRINIAELFPTNSTNKRFSMFSGASSGSLFKRDSMKSYLSYDSALSTSSNIKHDIPQESNLRKKNGYQDLRKMANFNLTDFNNLCDEQEQLYEDTHGRGELPFKVKTTSMASRVSSSRKSVRFSTFYALTELPFNDFRESYVVLNRTDTNQKHKLIGEFSDNSAFSYGPEEKKSSQTMSNSNRQSTTSSVVIPGISSYALKELASIPDQDLKSNNPVKFTLHILEGKGNKSVDTENTSMNTTSDSVNPEKTSPLEKNDISKEESASFELQDKENNEDVTTFSNGQPKIPEMNRFHDEEEILAEINNADTKDAIDYSSDIEKELRERPVTPIKTRPRTALNPSLSAPNMNAFLMSVTASENLSPPTPINPKVVLDGYSLTSKSLSVEEVMRTGSHVSFVLSYTSTSLADHFTIIERDMLQEIDWRELVELQWNKDLSPVNSWLEIIVNETYYSKNKGVNLVISRFNLMVNWIISEILLTKTEEERIMIISRFIHVAYHSLVLQNFSTLMQVILALSSEKIAKLKLTWNKLHPGDILTFKNLEEMTSPLQNFINIRVCTNLVQPSRGCIPFVGLYLSDLIFNAERPKYAKKPAKLLPMAPPTAPAEPTDRALTLADSSIDSNSTDTDNERLINFSRFRTSVHIVKSLSQCIEWSNNYSLPVEDELLRKCLYIKSLDEEEMNYCLQTTETLN